MSLFSITGAHLVQHGTGRITIVAKEIIGLIQLLTVASSKENDRPATHEERTKYRSVIGKMLYVDRLSSPLIAYYVLQAATKCADLRLHHLRSRNLTIRSIRKSPCEITFLRSKEQGFKLEAMSDGSMRTTDDKTNVREGIILFRRCGEVVHTIEWTSRLAKRVARSTSTAELFAAGEAVNKITYFKHLVEQNLGALVETT